MQGFRWGHSPAAPTEALKKPNQGDMDEKNPVFGVFLIHGRLCKLPGLVRFHLLQIILRCHSLLIEMRQGRLSIKKSPWFDFFRASVFEKRHYVYRIVTKN
jgi:hypothetical protein